MRTKRVYWLDDAPLIIEKQILLGGASVRDVAREAGVNYVTIYNIIKGKTTYSLRSSAQRIAKTLKIELNTLIKHL